LLTKARISCYQKIESLSRSELSKLLNRELSSLEFFRVKQAGIVYLAVFSLCDWELACIVKKTLTYKYFYQELLNNPSFVLSLSDIEKRALVFHEREWEIIEMVQNDL